MKYFHLEYPTFYNHYELKYQPFSIQLQLVIFRIPSSKSVSYTFDIPAF